MQHAKRQVDNSSHFCEKVETLTISFRCFEFLWYLQLLKNLNIQQ